MAKVANSLLGHIRKGTEGMWREVVFCLYSSLKPHCVQLWAPQYKNKMDLLDSDRLQRWLGDWNIFQMWKAWKSWDHSAWRREAWGCLTHKFKYLRGWNEEYNARLFSVLLRDKRQWAQIENMEFHLNARKHCSTVRLVKHIAQKG